MTDRRLRRTAWLLCAVSVAGVCGQAGLLVLAGVPLLSSSALDQAFPIVSAAVVVGAVLGAGIVGRHPRHRIGWLFCLGQAGAAIGLAAQAFPLAVVEQESSRWPAAAHWAGWLSHLLGSTYALTLLGLLLLLAPNGRLPGRRWAAVAVFLVGGYLVVVAGLLLLPPDEFPVDDRGKVEGLPAMLGLAGQLAIAVGLVGGAAALLVRHRRSRGEERQQLRWIGVAAGLFALTVVILVADGLSRPAGESGRWYFAVLFYLGYLAVPLATGIAVLRYRLYDIDVIVGQAVRLAVLGAFVTAGYIAVVVAAGGLIGGSSSVVVSLLAYVVVALAFQPMRRRVAQLADRVVHGHRAVPYDALAELGRQLAAGSRSDVDLPELVARAVARAVGARQVWVTVAVPGGPDVVRAWRRDGDAGRPQLTVPVGSGTETFGRIDIAFAPGRSLDRARRRLLNGLLAPAGVAFRNIRLTAELQAQVETLSGRRSELAASRRRLLTAADGESERVARQIRTDVAKHLASMPADLAGLADLVRVDAEGARRGLEDLRGRSTLAIEALRTMTAGVLPPLLTRRGLPVALEALAARQVGRPALTVGGGLADHRLNPSVEAAVYAVAVVALRDAGPDASVRLALDDGRLHLSISGRSDTATSDLRPVIDRVEAVGGQLEVGGAGSVAPGSGPGDVRVVIPLGPRDEAASSRSTPDADLLL